MGALLHQRDAGEGQHIDVSMLEAVVSTPPNFIHQYSFTGPLPGAVLGPDGDGRYASGHQ